MPCFWENSGTKCSRREKYRLDFTLKRYIKEMSNINIFDKGIGRYSEKMKINPGQSACNLSIS